MAWTVLRVIATRSRTPPTVPFRVRYRWRIGETEGRERRWSGNLWRSHHVAPTAATSPTCARTDRPHRSRRLSQRQPLSDPARHAWDDLQGWPLRRPLSQAGSASLSTLAPGPDHADAVPQGLERSAGGGSGPGADRLEVPARPRAV